MMRNKHFFLLSSITLIAVSLQSCYSIPYDQAEKPNRQNNAEEQMLLARQEAARVVEEREKEKQGEHDELETRRNVALEKARILANNRNVRIVELVHRFDITNPYAFDSAILYFCDVDYLYVWQWLEGGFIASFLPQEAAFQMPYNTEFFVRNVPGITRIKQRISNIYMVYIGTQTFSRVKGSTEVLAVFDILDYD